MNDQWRMAQNIEDTLDGAEDMPGGVKTCDDCANNMQCLATAKQVEECHAHQHPANH